MRRIVTVKDVEDRLSRKSRKFYTTRDIAGRVTLHPDVELITHHRIQIFDNPAPAGAGRGTP